MEINNWQGLDEIIDKNVNSEKYFSLDNDKIQQLAEKLAPSLKNDASQPIFWQLIDYNIDGNNVTYPLNNKDTMQFYLVAVAQFFSYWYKDGESEKIDDVARDKVKNWGININKKFIDDTIAVLICLYRALNNGINLLDPERLIHAKPEDVETIYNFNDSAVAPIPMKIERLKKFNEIGCGLVKFASDYSVPPQFIEMIRLSEGKISKIVWFMQKYFPYSYGDKYAKLPLLCIKILWDRTSVNLKKHNLIIQSADNYDELLNLKDEELFDAMADYMVPLFLIRYGAIKINDKNILNDFVSNREITHLNKIEESYRAYTLHAVRLIAEKIAVINNDCNAGAYAGRLRFSLDSVFWQNGLFLCKEHSYDNNVSERCIFSNECNSVNNRKLMIAGFPLVRTHNY